jgi:hypothetical protein
LRDARLQTPPGEPSSPSVPKTTKNDKVTKKTFKKEATTSVKQLKAKVVKEESEKEGDDIQEVEQEDVEEGRPTALSLRRVSFTSSAVPELVLRSLFMKLHVKRRARLVLRNLQGIGDVARSCIVLHPLPLGAKLGKGLREHPGDVRLLALVLESQLTSPKR